MVKRTKEGEALSRVWPKRINTVDTAEVGWGGLLEPFPIWVADDGLVWSTRTFLAGPVTPHLLRLEAGDTTSLERFIVLLGYPYELVRWGDTHKLWHVYHKDDEDETATLVARWSDQDTKTSFMTDQQALRDAWEQASVPQKVVGELSIQKEVVSRSTALEAVLYKASGHLVLDPDVRLDPTRTEVVMRPRDIVARSWFELVGMLKAGQSTKTCEHCGQMFPPRRRLARFCPKTSCYDDRYRANPSDHLREYQKMYKRYKRGTISPEDWATWQDQNDQRNR